MKVERSGEDMKHEYFSSSSVSFLKAGAGQGGGWVVHRAARTEASAISIVQIRPASDVSSIIDAVTRSLLETWNNPSPSSASCVRSTE